MTPKTFVVLFAMLTLSFQTLAGELGNSRGSSQLIGPLEQQSKYGIYISITKPLNLQEPKVGSYKHLNQNATKLGSYKWLRGTCYKIADPVNVMVENYNDAVKLCPKLRDYSAAEEIYFGSYANESYKQPIPPHNTGSICATKNQWAWALRVGPPRSACKIPTGKNSAIDGIRI